ncbi:hypothetical protein SAMN05660199_02472 [Klenkia soli]|uniref:DUF1772 domain-containing protein n=1 Tax=Klenkia soli TaxID=1052260 RepID=A0A1H0LZH1_9ACTN|nr:DUF1772 domain-containing protein [Klenkia soli]SDO73504.1 hypothetical protein SAMN05660199_02472 [Klenkia soli]
MGPMLLTVVHLVLVAAYAGFQWTVRVLVYPQFAGVGPGFAAYERAHQRRVTRVVGPLFVGQGVTTLWLLVLVLRGEAPAGPVVVGAACLAVVLGVTALGAVPLHRVLDAGWDAAAHRRLLRVDSVRVAAASAGVLAAAWLVLG